MSDQSKVLDKENLKNMSLDIIKAVEETKPKITTPEGEEIIKEVERMTVLMLTWVYNQSEKKMINE